MKMLCACVLSAVAVTAAGVFGSDGAAILKGEMVTMRTAAASCTVCLAGARVVSLRTKAGEVFWNDDPVQLSAGDWAHGGMPICWPWFGRREGLPIHGTAWKSPFKVTMQSETETRSELRLALETPELSLEYKLVLTDCLTATIVTQNRSPRPYPLSCGFHPFFLLGERDKARVTGLGAEPITVLKAMDSGLPVSPEGAAVRIEDPVLGRAIVLKSKGFLRMNMWNPGSEKNCPGTVPGDSWRHFLSVEPYMRQGTFVLGPGETHVGEFTISTESPCPKLHPKNIFTYPLVTRMGTMVQWRQKEKRL